MTDSANIVASTTCNGGESVLPECLPFLRRKSPDLTLIIERWPGLPEAVKAGIVAIVEATAEQRTR